ncbi:MAG: trypsin-like peptidase domain-containing protein [Pseudanabaena sp. M165S2SP1A06QC]|jgi:endonuclease G|nr:trypsin-like peptidase domain-containing protein [Pseudanabaena sp. M165S2SP1A06QC]
MNLSGSELRKLFQALLKAYPTQAKLSALVLFQLEESLAAIAGQDTLETVVLNLITWAKARGKLDRLIMGAYEENPYNPELREFYETIFKKRFIPSPKIVAKDFGPDIDWQETDEIQLQSWFQTEPDWYDVGFLKRAIAQTASVCRVEIPSQGITGTGVLISDKLVLTNYHVLKPDESADMQANALDAILRFGRFSEQDGKETDGQTFQLDRLKPILHSSPVGKLDYALLQLDRNTQAADIKPALWDISDRLEPRMGLNLLQHPEGDSMKISISSDAVTGVYQESGLVHYVNKSAGGSSGSPCFNESGRLVALHHAQRSKSFGLIREGILFSAIYREISSYLL